MTTFLSQDLQELSSYFLKQSCQQRLLILQQLGLARYASFLTKMQLTEANVICIMRFFEHPNKVKFPQLQGADLSELVLDGANFIRGNLSHANLKGSSLIDADLIFANFTNADLRNANLTGATLNDAVWCDALVVGCQCGVGIGLTLEQCQYLQSRGAIFKFD